MAANQNVYLQFKEASDRVSNVPEKGVIKFPTRKTGCWYNIFLISIITAVVCGGGFLLLRSLGDVPEFMILMLQLGIPACWLLAVLYMLIRAFTDRVVIDDQGMRCPESGRIEWGDIEAATLSDNIFWDDVLGLKKLNPKAYGTVELRILSRENAMEDGRPWNTMRILNSVTNADQPMVLYIIRKRLGNRFLFPEK